MCEQPELTPTAKGGLDMVLWTACKSTQIGLTTPTLLGHPRAAPSSTTFAFR